MRFKNWLAANFVLVLTFVGTVAWFYYWDQLKSESARSLQSRLNEMELQRFQEEKGKQVLEVAQQAAERYDQWLTRLQRQVERMADVPTLRRPHKRLNERKKKQDEFLSLWKKYRAQQPFFIGAWLTDEQGQIIASAGTSPALGSLKREEADFQKAAQQRISVVQITTPSPDSLQIKITTPCLTEEGVFLGVLQTIFRLSAAAIFKNIGGPEGMPLMLATYQGRRLTTGPSEGFPENLGALMNKNLKEMEYFVKQTGAVYFKGRWEGTNYLLGMAVTRTSPTILVTWLKVSELEKVLGPPATPSGMFTDPVVLGGLGVVLCLGLVLMLFFSGGSSTVIKKVNQQLREMLQSGEEWTLLKASGGSEGRKLIDTINTLIGKSQTALARARESGGGIDAELLGPQTEEWQQMKTEIEELRHTQNQISGQNQELKQEVETLTQQNQELLHFKEAAQMMVSAPASEPIENIITSYKEASALRIEAITSMSEDLKATLNVIKNYISSILASEEGKITDKQQEFLGVVINKSARLERQINDLLDISHMENEATEMYLTKADVVSMLQDVVLNMQPQADIKQIKLNAEIQSPLPEVMINSDRLGQAFINLVQHAIKITHFSGEVKIAATETLSDIVVKIRDGGTPLTLEQASYVFNTFSGPDSKSGTDFAGTGLRFPIIKRIVDAHNGTIAIRGLPEQGNEVVVTLPKLTPEEMAASAKTERSTEVYTPATSFTEKPSEPVPPAPTPAEEEQPFDLSSFMGKMEENNNANGPAITGTDENLDELLRDIESIDGQMGKP